MFGEPLILLVGEEEEEPLALNDLADGSQEPPDGCNLADLEVELIFPRELTPSFLTVDFNELQPFLRPLMKTIRHRATATFLTAEGHVVHPSAPFPTSPPLLHLSAVNHRVNGQTGQQETLFWSRTSELSLSWSLVHQVLWWLRVCLSL